MRIKNDENDAAESDFDRWWDQEGSGIAPFPGEDAEEHVERVARIAWENGEYVEKHRDKS